MEEKITIDLTANKEILENIKDEPGMKKYPLKNGVLICPENWIIVNPEEANEMMYAGVIECRNSEKFGKEKFGKRIPHLVFFSNKKYGKDYRVSDTEYINHLCIQAWPEFQMVIDSQVDPIKDPEKPGHYINNDEWMNAPTIGYFSIYEHGDPGYGDNYQPPAGARIIRINNSEE